LKRSFGISDFLLKYHQNPQVLKRQSKEKKREEEKEKLQESPQIKGKLMF
jgi:type III secretory pathway component EscU